MSVISSTHSVVAYDPKTTKPFEAQRLAKVLYKTPRMLPDGTTPEKKQNMCVSIPRIGSISEAQMVALRVHVIGMLENAQDAIVRTRVEAGAASIADTELSIDSCIAWLDADSKGDRLTKEYIIAWYGEVLADILVVAIADKLGIGDAPNEAEAKKLEQRSNVYRDNFAMLAGGKTQFSADKAGKLVKVLELVSEDELAGKFITRLKGMQVKEQVELLDL